MHKGKSTAAARDKRGGAAKQERDEQRPLVDKGESEKGMDNLPEVLLVRITRVYSGRGRRYDDDNFSGGCKELRDTIAENWLKRKGDSQEDGLYWEYRQEKGEETKTIIEIYKKED